MRLKIIDFLDIYENEVHVGQHWIVLMQRFPFQLLGQTNNGEVNARVACSEFGDFDFEECS